MIERTARQRGIYHKLEVAAQERRRRGGHFAFPVASTCAVFQTHQEHSLRPTSYKAVGRRVRAAILAILLSWVGSAFAGPSYVYDQVGRLTTVYDASGNAAVYKYDAVGNLLSITNYSSTQFQALEDSSNSGSVGSTVVLYGTDICANPTVVLSQSWPLQRRGQVQFLEL